MTAGGPTADEVVHQQDLRALFNEAANGLDPSDREVLDLHLRHDIGAAVRRAADLPHDPLVLEVTIEWMLAGIPQMCTAALAACEQGVNLVFTDLRHSVFVLRPGAPGELWTVTPGTDDSLPICVTSAHEFVSWGTKRNDWRSHAQLTDQAAAPTLDAINVI